VSMMVIPESWRESEHSKGRISFKTLALPLLSVYRGIFGAKNSSLDVKAMLSVTRKKNLVLRDSPQGSWLALVWFQNIYHI